MARARNDPNVGDSHVRSNARYCRVARACARLENRSVSHRGLNWSSPPSRRTGAGVATVDGALVAVSRSALGWLTGLCASMRTEVLSVAAPCGRATVSYLRGVGGRLTERLV